MLDRRNFFVSCILWVKECKEITTNSVTSTRDLVRQGHAWLQVTFPISGSIHARSMIFFVSCILWVKECKEITTNSVTLTRDLVRQGHAWWQVTFPISGSIHARLRSWLLFDCIPWPRICKKQKNNLRSSMYTTRDRQGHLWQRVTLTYKVTRQGNAVGCYLIAFPDPEYARNKKKSSI